LRQRYGLHKRVIKENKESSYHRLQTKWNRPTTIFSTREFKGAVIILLVLAVFFIPVNGYYNNNILGHLLPTPKLDPFTTLWNGQINNKINTTSTLDFIDGPPSGGIQCGGTCAPAQTLTDTVKKNDALIVIINASPSINCGVSVIDTQGNIYTNPICSTYSNTAHQFNAVSIWVSIASLSGSDTITVAANTGQAYFGTFLGYTNINSITGGNQLPGITGNVTSSGQNTLSPLGIITGIVFGNFVCSGIGCSGGIPTGTLRQSFSFAGGVSSIDDSLQTFDTWTYNFTANPCHTCNIDHIVIDLQTLSTSQICGQAGYQCSNMKIVNGYMQSNRNSTFPSIALTNSSISLANSASKSLAFNFGLVTNTPFIGEEFGFYLTRNGTLPNRAGDINYSPTNDSSVSLAVILVVTANKYNYYVYMQRPSSITQKMFIGTETPIIPCNQASTIYLCANNTTNADSTFPIFPLVLNYTGSATGGTTGAGQSYLCTDFGGGSTQCNLGGANNIAIGITNTNFRINYTQPWLNLQNNYYVGLWQKATSNPTLVKFSTAKNNVISSQVISIYSPSSSNSNVAEGGFFGWLKNAFISNTCASLKALTLFLADPCTSLSNAPQDLATAFVNGLLLVFTTLAIGFKTLLNGFGNLVGDGNIGDNIFSFFANMGGYFTTVFSIAIAQFGNELTVFIAELNAVVNFISLTNMFPILSSFVTNFALWIALFNTPFGDIMFLVGNLTYFAALLFIMWYLYLGFTIFWSGAESGINTIKESASTIASLFKLFFETGLVVIDMALRVKGLIARWL
jgi:hypothetical protein